MSEAYEKGRGLEGAVLSIESTILKSSPGLAENSFRIETRKIVTVSGVRHEFDLWVEVDPAPGYAARFVFECKNWSDKVGKNEIIVFSEKVKAVQAQRGFFVAREFTRDAQAQAELDPRLRLLEVKEEAFEDLLVPLRLHVLAVDNQEVEISLREVGVTDAGDAPQKIDFASASAMLRPARGRSSALACFRPAMAPSAFCPAGCDVFVRFRDQPISRRSREVPPRIARDLWHEGSALT